MTEDARRAPRAQPKMDEPVEIQLMSDHFLDIFEARDVSITGVGIFVPYRFEDCNVTSPVALVITLPDEPPFLAKGRVVHRSKTEREFFGVEFQNLANNARERIARYVERVLREAEASST